MNIGIAIIALAWLWLVYRFWQKGERGLNPWFIRLYIVGSLIIFLDTFNKLSSWPSWVALLNLLAPLYILWKKS
ncbi:MAG: hypothetical protein AAB900_03145 [Patescibacteria group bacterium]